MLKNVKMLNIRHFQDKKHYFLKFIKKAIFVKIDIFPTKLIMVMTLKELFCFKSLNFVFDVFLLEHYAPDVHSNNYS